MSQFWCQWWNEMTNAWKLCGGLNEEAQAWYSYQVDSFLQQDERDHKFRAHWLVWKREKGMQKLLLRSRLINSLLKVKQQALLDSTYVDALIERYNCEAPTCSNNGGFYYVADGKIHLRIFIIQLKAWSIAINRQLMLDPVIPELLIAFSSSFPHLEYQ